MDRTQPPHGTCVWMPVRPRHVQRLKMSAWRPTQSPRWQRVLDRRSSFQRENSNPGTHRMPVRGNDVTVAAIPDPPRTETVDGQRDVTPGRYSRSPVFIEWPGISIADGEQDDGRGKAFALGTSEGTLQDEWQRADRNLDHLGRR